MQLPPLLMAAAASTPVPAMLNCEKLLIDGVSFNFKPLGGPHSIATTQYEPPNHLSTSYTLDICAPLEKKDGVKKEEQCSNGTRVCGIKRITEGETNLIEKVIPISYAETGQPLDWAATRLRDSASNTDKGKEGVRLEMGGGRYAGIRQKAILELICDPDKDGNEEGKKPEDEDRQGKEGDEGDDKDKEGKREEEDGGQDDDAGKEKQPHKTGAALTFISYDFEKNSDWEGDVLRLEWKTKHACEAKRGDDGAERDESKHWGFFTWIIVISFLAISTYLVFGSWLNYSRYGARGWDLVPHGDTIRDVPYLMKDWTRSVLNTVQGSGTRGGYSAV